MGKFISIKDRIFNTKYIQAITLDVPYIRVKLPNVLETDENKMTTGDGDYDYEKKFTLDIYEFSFTSTEEAEAEFQRLKKELLDTK